MRAWRHAVVKVELLLKVDDARTAIDGKDVRVDPTVILVILVDEQTIGNRSLTTAVDRLEAARLDVDNALMKPSCHSLINQEVR